MALVAILVGSLPATERAAVGAERVARQKPSRGVRQTPARGMRQRPTRGMRRRPTRGVGLPRPARAVDGGGRGFQRRAVSQRDVEQFLNTAVGDAKMQQYTAEAMDVPRYAGTGRYRQAAPTLRQQRKDIKARGLGLGLFSYGATAVTAPMFGFIGGFVGMLKGGLPGPELLASGSSPITAFIAQPEVLIGATIGAALTAIGGTYALVKSRRAAKRIDRQAEAEARGRITHELETGEDLGAEAASQGVAAQALMRTGAASDFMQDLAGNTPGGVFGMQGPGDYASSNAPNPISDPGPGSDFGMPGTQPMGF